MFKPDQVERSRQTVQTCCSHENQCALPSQGKCLRPEAGQWFGDWIRDGGEVRMKSLLHFWWPRSQMLPLSLNPCSVCLRTHLCSLPMGSAKGAEPPRGPSSHTLCIGRLPLSVQGCLWDRFLNRGKHILDKDLALNFLEGDRLWDRSKCSLQDHMDSLEEACDGAAMF